MAIISLIACVSIAFIAEFVAKELWLKILLIALSLTVLFVGVIFSCVIDNSVGKFQCPHCGEKFVPTLGSYVVGIHGITWRMLKCPNCGKKGLCKKIYFEKE